LAAPPGKNTRGGASARQGIERRESRKCPEGQGKTRAAGREPLRGQIAWRATNTKQAGKSDDTLLHGIPIFPRCSGLRLPGIVTDFRFAEIGVKWSVPPNAMPNITASMQ
jgi:hypothetical protein